MISVQEGKRPVAEHFTVPQDIRQSRRRQLLAVPSEG
jgi:hypothetical protein